MNNSNHVQHAQDIKVEEIDIKHEEVRDYNDDQENLQVQHIMIHQNCFIWMKQENQTMHDEIDQPQSTFCYYCKLTHKEQERRTIITRQYRKKLDKHQMCPNYY